MEPAGRLQAAIGRQRCRSQGRRWRRFAGRGPGNSLGAGRQPGWGRGGVGRRRWRRGAEGGGAGALRRARVGAALRELRVRAVLGRLFLQAAGVAGSRRAGVGPWAAGCRPCGRKDGWGEAGMLPQGPARTRSFGR